MIALCIVGIIFSTSCAMINLTNHRPFWWIGFTVNLLCVSMYVLMLIGAINRRTEVKKHICDLCNGELVEPRKFGQDGIESGIAAIFQDVSVFRARAVYKITKFTLSLPFGMANHKDMDICEKCMNDFKEFVQRKQSYQSGDKK